MFGWPYISAATSAKTVNSTEVPAGVRTPGKKSVINTTSEQRGSLFVDDLYVSNFLFVCVVAFISLEAVLRK